MVEKLGEITEREFRGYWDQTIADAGDPEATLQAMARQDSALPAARGFRCNACLRALGPCVLGQPWAMNDHSMTSSAVVNNVGGNSSLSDVAAF